MPEDIINYFDFEAYGRDMRLNEGGHFAPGGYLTRVSNNFVELYHGIEDIPQSTGYLHTPSFPSGSRWQPTKKLLTALPETRAGTLSFRDMKIVSTSRHFVPKQGGGIAG